MCQFSGHLAVHLCPPVTKALHQAKTMAGTLIQAQLLASAACQGRARLWDSTGKHAHTAASSARLQRHV